MAITFIDKAWRAAVLLCSLGSAQALTPLPDQSPGFFAGEWAGSGQHGAYCYLKLDIDGGGRVLIDGGSGDWLGAGMHWRNARQTMQVERITPLPASSRLRIMPLMQFKLVSGLNQSLRLTWTDKSAGCHLQKIEAGARQLERARSTLEALQAGGRAQ